MRNLYRIQKKRQSEELNSLLNQYAFFAFSNDQFKEGIEKLGTKEIKSIGLGGFIRADKQKDLEKLLRDHREERQRAINDPKTGKRYIVDMFMEELENHEYSYTGDTEEALDALGYTWEAVREDPRLFEGLTEAIRLIDLPDTEESRINKALEHVKKNKVVTTNTLMKTMRNPQIKKYIDECLNAFYCGDFGIVDDEDILANRGDLADGRGRVLAKYPAIEGMSNSIYVIAYFSLRITGDDFNYTTILYCDEY